MAQLLKEELLELGLEDVVLRNNAILTATLPANTSKETPTVAFFAHLDTSAEQVTDTHAQVVAYEGLETVLCCYLNNSECDPVLSKKISLPTIM